MEPHAETFPMQKFEIRDAQVLAMCSEHAFQHEFGLDTAGHEQTLDWGDANGYGQQTSQSWI